MYLYWLSQLASRCEQLAGQGCTEQDLHLTSPVPPNPWRRSRTSSRRRCSTCCWICQACSSSPPTPCWSSSGQRSITRRATPALHLNLGHDLYRMAHQSAKLIVLVSRSLEQQGALVLTRTLARWCSTGAKPAHQLAAPAVPGLQRGRLRGAGCAVGAVRSRAQLRCSHPPGNRCSRCKDPPQLL